MKIKELFCNNIVSNHHIIRPYIIAEAGVNHEGSMDTAYRLIREAKEGGADAIKFQTYKAGTIACKESPSYWDTEKESTDSQYKLFQKYDNFWKDEYVQLKMYCDEVGIEFMSTPFDVESATFLNELMSVFKISSSDITNKPFIEYICEFGKPIILSTGASYLHEIQAAVDWIDAKQTPVALLHCILNYPTEDKNANLGMIKNLQMKFPDKLIGYSDHTLPKDMKVLETATLLGSVILEKHFTHDKSLPGNDHYHAMDKMDLTNHHKRLDQLFDILGSQSKYALKEETPARQNARRSLVAAIDIKCGDKIDYKHLTWKRPAYGISPSEIDKVMGKCSMKDISEDEVINWNMLN